MSMQGDKVKATQPEVIEHLIRAVGGSSAITKVTGTGLTVTRTGAGAYLVTWAENPGTHLTNQYGLSATTPGDLAGHTVIFGAYNATARTLAFVLYNASFAAHDLAALEWVDLTIRFKRTGV